MIKDLLVIREIYNDLFRLKKQIDKNLGVLNINVTPLHKAMEYWQGQWSVKFSTFLGQVGRKK